MARACFLSLLFTLFGVCLQAQDQAEMRFKAIQKQINTQEYSQAIENLEILCKEYPNSADYQIVLGRVYAWDQQLEASIRTLQQAIKQFPDNEEAYLALLKTYLWAQKFEAMLALIQSWNPPSTQGQQEWTEMNALALTRLDRDSDALSALNQILAQNPANHFAKSLQTEIWQKQHNQLSISYLNTVVSKPTQEFWHLAALEYKRKSSKITWITRLNWGQAFGNQAAQLEADAYTPWGKKAYQYFNLGFSNQNLVFPQIRAGTEWYQSLFKAWSVSLGARYLQFTGTEVQMITSQLAYTHQRFTWAYRPLAARVNAQWFPNHSASVRYSIAAKEQFTQVEFQYGTLPYFFFNSQEFNRNTAYRVAINAQFRIKEQYFIKPLLMYEYEEFVPAQFRSRFNTQLMLSKRF